MLIRRHGRQIGLERFAHHDPGPAKRILANDARKDKTLSALFDSADKPADAMRTLEAATGGTRNSRPGLVVHDEPVEIAGLPGFLGIGGHPGQPAMQRGNNMRLRIFTIVLTGIVLMTLAASLVVAGDACSLLTQSQVSEALGMSVGAGTPISGPASCQWMGKGKWATLTITQPLAGKSAVDRFNSGKAAALPGITKEPASGVGDEAYYVHFSNTSHAGLGLVVRKGNSAFEIRIYGFDVNEAKPVAKTLAADAAKKM